MARPRKNGLDYFPLDVDFFGDEKIEAIIGEFGLAGEAVTLRLMCAIYRSGYYIAWNDMMKMKMRKDVPWATAEAIEKIVVRLAEWGFFDKSTFDDHQVLTSKGFQRRYFEAKKKARMAGVKFQYILLENEFSANKTPNNDSYFGNNPIKSDNNSENSTQSKVKNSKVNNPLYISPQENNIEGYFEKFFSEGNSERIVQNSMALHTTVEKYKEIALELKNEWQIAELPHWTYSDFALHLQRAITYRYNGILKQQPTNADQALQQRRAEFAEHIANDLASPEVHSDLQGLY